MYVYLLPSAKYDNPRKSTSNETPWLYEKLLLFLIISVIINAELNFQSRGNLHNFETKREMKTKV